MKPIYASLVLVFLLTTGAVGEHKAKTAYKKSFDFSRLHRFALADPNTTGPALIDGSMSPEDRFRVGLITELDARGFQFVPADEADFLVRSYLTGPEEDIDSGDGHAGDVRMDHPKSAAVTHRQKHKAIAVEFFDVTNRQLIWRGRINAQVHALDQSGWEVDNAKALVNRFLKDIDRELSY